MKIREIIKRLDIRPGDEVVSMTSHHGWLFVVTRLGMLYCIETEGL